MKYEIDYIEFWATGHCNLNCKGCSSCSPIAEKWFLDLKSIRRDLMRLKELDINIHNITILGGEPLLHPELSKIMDAVKEVYPDARLGLITNGLLLMQMPCEFWNACVKYNAKLSITCFPVMSEDLRCKIKEKLQNEKLDYHMTNKKRFNKILTQDHTGDIQEITEACGCNHAYNLKDGKVARCTVPMAIPILNARFNAGMLETGTCDIYAARSGAEIIDFFSKLNEACKNCSAKPMKVDWEKADDQPQLSDWII